ncbi:hypothetical protein DPSP01_011809 [Paraphaeosphaeria sporulosa]
MLIGVLLYYKTATDLNDHIHLTNSPSPGLAVRSQRKPLRTLSARYRAASKDHSFFYSTITLCICTDALQIFNSLVDISLRPLHLRNDFYGALRESAIVEETSISQLIQTGPSH